MRAKALVSPAESPTSILTFQLLHWSGKLFLNEGNTKPEARKGTVARKTLVEI
ncbi:MAG: hypothetical protein WBA24_14510 [Geitlerinemataceae cyanobacterium]